MTERFLMCRPDHFEVAYVINPWMAGNIAQADQALAMRQWQGLVAALESTAEITCIAPQAGLPDMVFTANAGLVQGDVFVPARFRHPQRRGEEAHFIDWFAAQGYRIRHLPPEMRFEGAGDALFDRRLPLLWLGHGLRSDDASAALLADILDIEVAALQLVDPRFYHLDTCFCPLAGGHLMYYPAAFDAASQALIAARVAPELRIAVSADDALGFACNAVNSGARVLMNHASEGLQDDLRRRGFAPQCLPLSQFIKAGGAAKCLTLRLDEA